MKFVKLLLKIVLWIVALLVLALLALPLWIGPVVKVVANSQAPAYLKTGFHLGHFSLNPYTARLELGDLQLENPKGYSEKFAVTLGRVTLDVETASLTRDVIHIEEISFKDVFVSYVTGGEESVSNFTQIQRNVSGEGEKVKGSEKVKGKGERSREEVSAAGDEGTKAEKKYIIDRLEVSGLLIQNDVLPIRLPSFTITDIGKKRGGGTLSEIGQEIFDAILKEASKLGASLKDTGKLAGMLLGDGVSISTDFVKDAPGNTPKAVRKLFKQGLEATGKATEKTGEVVGDGAKAVGDAAGKALKSLKKLKIFEEN